jgi:hypothetical protein
MATFTKFDSFVENLAEKVHNLGSDTLTVNVSAGVRSEISDNAIAATNAINTSMSARAEISDVSIAATSAIDTSVSVSLEVVP